MRDPARIRPLLEELAQLWELFPDMRFGQLVQNIPTLAGRSSLPSDWFIEEDQWLEWIQRAKLIGGGIAGATAVVEALGDSMDKMDEYRETQADNEERYTEHDLP